MAEDVFGIVGTVVAGAYKVEAVVAEGGFGVVYRAYHSGFRAPVAVKCLKVPQQLSASQETQFLEQFQAEAELLFHLSASIPTVVRPLHVDAMTLPDGRFVPFMVLEWLDGETLDSIAQRRKAEGLPPIPLRKLVRMLTPVARALERAHNFQGASGPLSIVHRDLKPENIFVANVAGEEVVKILDFGIGKAKSMASQVAGRASQGSAVAASFTPAYGAPEQWVPKRFGQTGPWTDVWGLALTMVEVLAGRTIIDGDQSAMMGTVLDPNRRPTPRNEGLDVSDAVETVFQRAMALDPRDRQADAGLFWNELTAAVGVSARDGRDGLAPSHRDARAEPGAIPRADMVEGVARARVPSGARRLSDATLPAQAAAVAGFYPDLSAHGPPPPSGGPVPDLELDIPDLSPSRPPAPLPEHSPYSRALDFDEAAAAPRFDLEVDLPEGERPVARAQAGRPEYAGPNGGPSPGASRPDWPIPAPPPPAPAEPRRRQSSAAVPAVNPNAQPIAQPAQVAAPPQSVPPSAPASTRAVPSARDNPPAPMAPRQPSLRPGASSPQVPLAGFRVPEFDAAPEPTLLRRIVPGASLVLLSILVTLGDQMYAASSGELFTLGPVRATWIAGLLMVTGVVLIAVRLIPGHRT